MDAAELERLFYYNCDWCDLAKDTIDSILEGTPPPSCMIPNKGMVDAKFSMATTAVLSAISQHPEWSLTTEPIVRINEWIELWQQGGSRKDITEPDVVVRAKLYSAGLTLELMRERLKKENQRLADTADSSFLASPTNRLIVNIVEKTIALDGVSYRVKYAVATFFKAMLDANGERIAMTEFGLRKDRNPFKSMPIELLKMVDIEDKKGAKLRLKKS